MLQPLNRQTAHNDTHYPERIVQFGGGNFLRGFVDWIVQRLNDETDFASSVVIIKPTPQGSYDDLTEQDGLFHVRLNRLEAGEPVSETALITCVTRAINPYADYDAYLSLARQPEIRFIASNTTESGITFDPTARLDDQPSTGFPAKLTAFLYERYRHFEGSAAHGCIILPCELIERNGDQLKAIMLQYAELWQLESGFAVWIEKSNVFCTTLVDRIVSGFPQNDSAAILESLGFEDRLLVEGEYYHSWIIEAPAWIGRELPFDQTTLNVKIVEDARPYHTMKVRILNGAHTSMVALGIFLGLETVREAVEHPVLGKFVRELVFEEIIPTLGMPDSAAFADAVLTRFRNPFIHHRLASIALNSLSKFRARLLPTLTAYARHDQLPERLVFVFAVLIRFYKADSDERPIKDDPAQVAWVQAVWESGVSSREVAQQTLSNVVLWGTDLSAIPHLVERVSVYFDRMEAESFVSILENTTWKPQ